MKKSFFVVLVLLVLVSGVRFSSAVEDFQDLDTEIGSVEERRLIVQLNEQRKRNEEQLKEIEQKKIELNLLRSEVDKKLDDLNVLRRQVEQLLAEKDARELAKIAELSQMYNKMDSAQAARIIQELDRELAIGILGGMKAKSAGKVLANIGGERAARLSAAYATLKED
ncbi:hypothetical protein HTZ97_14660 [Desulfuromonas acetoxidans]|uniref:Magnesium transporter MgtE intracellular domain-containing protein n=1 Tax=Desulfuromonas acetoxidans (strain DSM 684 / 11070) TaxID=281689 RepID=Q1JZT4_DESA6|nr:hypothetical protein [Desulfuromonas acetoxidans]EAT15808.1 conserved hypothetical protein [Desulfuromonas acetoxidans DSM 684]MBF0644990.1 hypothetical protein [Desulfuromonas acetoxidans]NVD25646.1 hypothetical protein [Desulfuromonas acetoxidans]NVE17699.1 hypothetical protein [Desulfuromonas acetoxidans]